MGILGLGERQRVRLFATPDVLERFVSCLVCIPRDRFNTENREGGGGSWSRRSAAATSTGRCSSPSRCSQRVHIVVHCPNGAPREYDEPALERAARRRPSRLDRRPARRADRGARRGARAAAVQALRARVPGRLPRGLARALGGRRHRADRGARRARGADPAALPPARGARRDAPLQAVQLARRSRCRTCCRRSSTWARGSSTSARTRSPRWAARRCGSTTSGCTARRSDLEQACELFQEAFLGVWRGELEDDGLNGLVLKARLTRARDRDPARDREVPAPGRDRVLRPLHGARRCLPTRRSPSCWSRCSSRASTRAGTTQRRRPAARGGRRRDRRGREPRRGPDPARLPGGDRRDAAHQLLPGRTPTAHRSRTSASSSTRSGCRLLPLPRPRFEIFVYSPRVEGVHLRGGKVARGGAALVGPARGLPHRGARPDEGADGQERGDRAGRLQGRVRRQAPAESARPAARGPAGGGDRLLQDLPVGPARPDRQHRRRRDRPARRGSSATTSDDPYLVVAADKGTATFSDIANGVSPDYGFWLGDAFASGGSHGYDHKAMGDHRPRRLGVGQAPLPRARRSTSRRPTSPSSGSATCPATCSATACCCRRTSGCSAAFNHLHIFLDPDPDPAASFAERRRLFELPRSAWSDYDPALISAGGGVFPRTAKSIPLSPQVRASARHRGRGAGAGRADPAILRAPVDLLWNGGIGTYVKARPRRTPTPATRPTTPCGRRRRAALPGRRRGRQPRLHPARADRVRAGRRPDQHRRDRQRRRRQLLRPRGQHQDPARRRWSRAAT